MVARFAPPKRHDLAVEAFSRVLAVRPSAELLLVGDGPLTERVRRHAQSLRVDHAVRFLGHQADARALLASADIALLASDYEGCPFAVLEAMHAGLPIVVTDVGGMHEIISDGSTGFVVPLAVDAIATALLRLMQDRQLAARFGELAQDDARARFTESGWGRMTLAVYDELLSESRVRKRAASRRPATR
jgi:glycosyltransferase involved in cell wall biosynthesis